MKRNNVCHPYIEACGIIIVNDRKAILTQLENMRILRCELQQRDSFIADILCQFLLTFSVNSAAIFFDSRGCCGI